MSEGNALFRSLGAMTEKVLSPEREGVEWMRATEPWLVRCGKGGGLVSGRTRKNLACGEKDFEMGTEWKPPNMSSA